MKHHRKQYEDVFSSDRPETINKLDISKVKIEGMTTGEYELLFKNFLKEFYLDLFNNSVKLVWLRKKFTCNGHVSKRPFYKTVRFLQGQFTKYIRRTIGNDIQIITKGPFLSKLETYYFDDFFPGFDEGNPFENPEYYKFPYKNITMEFLPVVYQLDDRFDLLNEADDKKMNYAVFLDYVLNHTLCENDDLGRSRYFLTQSKSRMFPYFFRDSDKEFYPKKGSKRI